MGFALTIVYIVLTIISPEQFGPQWAHYHALEFLAGIAILVSVPNMLSLPYLKSSIQTYLLLGLFVAIGLSQIANGWFGGVLVGWQVFLPSAAIYIFVVTNVTTIRRLKVVTLAAIASCLVLVAEALCGYYGGYRGDMFVLHDHLFSNDRILGDIFRLRGVGFLNDPNDFAQILLIALPLLFIGWQRRRILQNSLLVLAPAGVLLWAIYLTHSRGALIGLTVLTLMAAREKLGATASAVLTAGLLLGVMALDFTGGRGVSASDGATTEAWASGLELFKGAPIFGVGFSNFPDLNGITAHNSFVLCLAELGLLGSLLWLALLVTTTLNLNNIVHSSMQWEAPLATAADDEEELIEASASACDNAYHLDSETADSAGAEPLGTSNMLISVWEESNSGADFSHDHADPITDAADISVDGGHESETSDEHIIPKRWIVLMRLALISFMTTSWFLSRSYSSTMYLVLGLATATIALKETETVSYGGNRWIFFTLVIYAALILFIYAVVRLRY